MDADVAVLAGKYAELRPHLDERAWRFYLGSEARAVAGSSGLALAAAVAVVAAAAGASRATVRAGAAELAGGAEPSPGRQRPPGAGRPRAEDAQSGLREALLRLADAGTRGGPMAELRWTTLSLRDLERQLAALGFRAGKDAVARVLKGEGYSLQGMAKVLEGSAHPDRDAQFSRINAAVAEFTAAGDPVVSVDAKKKEQLGPFGRDGTAWRPRGDPVLARSHDFPDAELGRIVPYGVYDIAANRGFVTVGTSRDTPAFAVASIRRWRLAEGSLRYPGARRLLITCDAGGSNACASHGWKSGLADLAAETGPEITVVHFPPGTSKWNKIEHRLFCHVTRTWRARPLMTPADAVAGITATVTAQGLKCTAVPDDGDCPAGLPVPPAQARELEARRLDRAAFHGEWNYALLPAPRPGTPEPEPGPGTRPAGRRVPAAVLNRPALAGTRPQDLAALAEALDGPFQARLAQRNYRLRNGPRVNRARADGPSGNRRLSLTDHLLAYALRRHLKLPGRATGALLGVDESSANRAAALAAELLTAACLTLPAAPPPEEIPRTPAALLAYARANGIPLALPENGYAMPEQFRTRTNRTARDTPETAN